MTSGRLDHQKNRNGRRGDAQPLTKQEEIRDALRAAGLIDT